jgi:hypothetical protein
MKLKDYEFLLVNFRLQLSSLGGLKGRFYDFLAACSSQCLQTNWRVRWDSVIGLI